MNTPNNNKRTIDDAIQAGLEAARIKEWYRKSAQIEGDSCVSAGKGNFGPLQSLGCEIKGVNLNSEVNP
jgi:hypothetical protein